MKKCKCGTMIEFVKTTAGKKMPVEIENPIYIMVKIEPADGFCDTYRQTAGLIPHWPNCPHAKQFKKGVKKNGN